VFVANQMDQPGQVHRTFFRRSFGVCEDLFTLADPVKNVVGGIRPRLNREAPDNTAGLESIALPWISKATIKEAAIQNATYMAVMRFVLADPEKRLFWAERFCFRGSLDNWIDIGGPA
jgi:hypothetical protein